MNGCTVGWPLLWAVWLGIDAQLKAEVQVRKLEGELRLKKNIWFFTTLLPSGLADEMGEQEELETLACHLAKLEAYKVWELMTKPLSLVSLCLVSMGSFQISSEEVQGYEPAYTEIRLNKRYQGQG